MGFNSGFKGLIIENQTGTPDMKIKDLLIPIIIFLLFRYNLIQFDCPYLKEKIYGFRFAEHVVQPLRWSTSLAY